MKIVFTKRFQKAYRKLPQAVQKKTNRRLKAVALDIRHPGVKAKTMTGVGDIWEGRVNGSYRFTFTVEGNRIVMRTVGTHEIYRNP